MNREIVVIGIGNEFRRDDGVGLAVAGQIAKRKLSGVRVLTSIGEPGSMLEAWTGVPVAIVVDAAAGRGAIPGRIRRWVPGDPTESAVLSSHALGLPQTYALGEALGQIPQKLVVFTVDIADTGHGIALSPTVAAAVPEAVKAVLAEI
jgi:hydrogenase maturation protease